ncbi:uncharacterized protein LOC109523947 [Hippocampus comes]|uniref:uncharacterized protein LOC109523947 n=1 Tax=Hippocampus comes TaxID=109280 RepID=UPI00094E7E64|nr:PREDICTED: uncharacterized protein LOC109523947 [Hippocampus comes]
MEKPDASGESNGETGSLFSYHSKSSRSATRLTLSSSKGSLSRSSASSRARVEAVLARAEAQGARARLAYAEEEINIEMEKARLEVSLDLLHQRREADAATAKADAMESAAAHFSMEERGEQVLEFLPVQTTPEQKVREYINKHGEAEPTHIESNSFAQLYNVTPNQEKHAGPPLSVFTPLHIKQEAGQDHLLPQDREPELQNTVTQPDAFHGGPQAQQRFNSNPCAADRAIGDLAKFLAKIQLLSGGLTQFDDKPEGYLNWKLTFQTTVADIGLTPIEEINLLLKWLGPESSQHATRVKAVHLRCPSVGLGMIWTRLKEVYGLPEAIENSFFSRIEKFPKLSRKDPGRLLELSDLIGELEAAKQDGHLPGLTYLDTPRGLGQLVEKLPFYLQEKWITAGSKYKEDHGVPFPPFSFFCEFVKGQTRARNDPSLNGSSLSGQFHCRAQKRKARKHAQKRKASK